MNLIQEEINKLLDLFNQGLFGEVLRKSGHLIKEFPAEKFIVKLQGVCHMELNEFSLAEKKFKEFVVLDENDPEIFNNLGILFHRQFQYQKSLTNFRKAISLDKNYFNAFNNLGCLFRDFGLFNEAIKTYKDGLVINQQNVELHQNLSHCLLITGQFEEGSQEYNWRWPISQIIEKNSLLNSKKMWDGKNTNVRLLLWREQGLGDEIFFLNFLRNLRKKIKKIKVIIDRRLKTIYENSFPEITFYTEQKNILKDDFDFHLPIGNLIATLHHYQDFLNYKSFPYLFSDQNKVNSLKAELPKEKKIIGIAWKTLNEAGEIDSKSIDISIFGELFKDKNCIIVPLQYGDVESDLEALRNIFGLEILEFPSICRWSDIDGLAALIDVCDLVISSSNSIVHLAGALRKPTKVFLPLVPSFWWLDEGKKTAWYDSVQLYRQKELESWSEPYYDMKSDIENFFDTGV